ncbi:MAG: phosphoribosyl-ATP diphosphatase [Anaerolineales bacterium]
MLSELFKIIEARKRDKPKGSYTAQLLASGEDEVLRKVHEEAQELIQAAESEGDQRVVEEMADLYYHTLVLLAARELSFAELEAELRRRRQQRE